jgi:NTE family protein
LNEVMASGNAGYGPDFVPHLNEAAGRRGGHQFRPINTFVVRPTEGIGQLAAEHIRKGKLRAGPALTRQLLRLLDVGVAEDADLASYLLFDGGFARRLVDLGRSDAQARRAELMNFFEPSVETDEAPSTEPHESTGWTLPPPAVG